jgi:hypothetical protein
MIQQDGQYTYNLLLGRDSLIIFAVESKSTYSECAPVALVIQHAKRINPIILSSVAYHNINMCFDFLYNFETFFTQRRSERDITISVNRSSRKVPVILLIF